ncbi:MAG: low-specificity L-threonine aldolase [Eubacteriales bacterium]|nr:low-specificity L-threonine aldolase [Eubacteriales bacterium]
MKPKLDMRSDTVTWPTRAMRDAMAAAEVGDDVYGDDPTTLELERQAARLLGKEAALFACSGTMGNQLALMAMVGRGEEVILSDQSHIVIHEAGAAAWLSGAQLRCLPDNPDGQMNLKAMEQAIRKHPEDIHSPATALICLENADSAGRVLPLSYMQSIKALADTYQLRVHLDGARLFNAAAALDLDPAALAACVDTVQICLSKGLCAPAGSLLVGPAAIINRARRLRKMIGGGMRQTGVLAAPGLIALNEMRLRLSQDHAAARWLADRLAESPQWFELVRPPEINMVFFRLSQYPLDADTLVQYLADRDVLINPPEDGIFRLVTHYWTKPDDLERLIAMLHEAAQAG